MGGHLFIINGDLTQLACDAILIPTDEQFKIESHWASVVSDHEAEIASLKRSGKQGWQSRSVLELEARALKPHVWLGNIGKAGKNRSFETFKPVINDFVTQAMATIKRADDGRIYKWPLPRLAVNVVGSGLGGGAQRKGALHD